MIRRALDSARRSAQPGGFLRHLITLVSATAIAQATPVLAFPILSRLYTPEAFGLLGIFSGVAIVLAIAASGRYELAIHLPADDTTARRVVILAASLAVITGAVLQVLIIPFSGAIARELGAPALGPWLEVLPVTVALMGIYQALAYWATRKRLFKNLALSRILQSVMNAVVPLVLGLLGFTRYGLIVGMVFSSLAATALLAYQCIGGEHVQWLAARRGLIAVAKVYREFPTYALPSNFVSSLANQLPVVLIGRYFGTTTAGLYAFTNRILNVPVTLLATAVGDVFRQRASEDFGRLGDCHRIYLRTGAVLTAMAVVPCAILFAFGPSLFSAVFGVAWHEAGVFARLLSVLLLFRFVASPLSYVFFVADGQRTNLAWQIGLAAVALTSLEVGRALGTPYAAILTFALSMSGMYMLNLALSNKLSRGEAARTRSVV